MPIKPEHAHRYPADWEARREFVLDRCKDAEGVERCELCGAPNGHFIARREDCGALWFDCSRGGPPPEGFAAPIRVVLTIAHLDPTYGCHEPSCLVALCQRCHLRIDAHIRHAEREVGAVGTQGDFIRDAQAEIDRVVEAVEGHEFEVVKEQG